jgi:hypothetical protein
MYLLRLKSCSRFVLIRRESAGAVIGLNPAGREKFRGQMGGSGERAKTLQAKEKPYTVNRLSDPA